jgi:hypothetical protein
MNGIPIGQMPPAGIDPDQDLAAGLVVVQENALRSAVEIVELPGSEGPEKGGEPDQAESQRDGNQI